MNESIYATTTTTTTTLRAGNGYPHPILYYIIMNIKTNQLEKSTCFNMFYNSIIVVMIKRKEIYKYRIQNRWKKKGKRGGWFGWGLS